MESLFEIPAWAIDAAYIIFIIGIFLILIKMYLAKSVFERILALDLLSAIVMCLAATFSIEQKNPVYIEISLCIAIIAFLGTAAYAKYLGKVKE